MENQMEQGDSQISENTAESDEWEKDPPVATPGEKEDEDYDAATVSEQDHFSSLSHLESMVWMQQTIGQMLQNDPLMCDLPAEVTLEEVNSQIAVEYGQAMTVFIRRGDNVVMPVVVVQNARVQDLKHAIQRYVTLKQTREGGTQCISWTYVWKAYWLYFDGQKLTDDNKRLKEYGIHNKDEVTFVKRLNQMNL